MSAVRFWISAALTLPFIVQMSGWLYWGGALLLGLGFLWHAVRLMNPPTPMMRE